MITRCIPGVQTILICTAGLYPIVVIAIPSTINPSFTRALIGPCILLLIASEIYIEVKKSKINIRVRIVPTLQGGYQGIHSRFRCRHSRSSAIGHILRHTGRPVQNDQHVSAIGIILDYFAACDIQYNSTSTVCIFNDILIGFRCRNIITFAGMFRSRLRNNINNIDVVSLFQIHPLQFSLTSRIYDMLFSLPFAIYFF